MGAGIVGGSTPYIQPISNGGAVGGISPNAAFYYTMNNATYAVYQGVASGTILQSTIAAMTSSTNWVTLLKTPTGAAATWTYLLRTCSLNWQKGTTNFTTAGTLYFTYGTASGIGSGQVFISSGSLTTATTNSVESWGHWGGHDIALGGASSIQNQPIMLASTGSFTGGGTNGTLVWVIEYWLLNAV